MSNRDGVMRLFEARDELLAEVDSSPPFDAIQRMIETLPAPTEAELDEIDARATAIIQKLTYDHHDIEPGTGAVRLWAGLGEPVICKWLTRSRDALETVRPPGWTFCRRTFEEFSGFNDQLGIVRGRSSGNEKLSELSCILLARAFEERVDREVRENGFIYPPVASG